MLPSGLSALQLQPAAIVAGQPSHGLVILSYPAPEGGAVVALASSHPDAVRLPPSITVPAGARTAVLSIATARGAVGTVRLSASLGGTTRTATLTVQRVAGRRQ